jgi:hypothetical protein
MIAFDFEFASFSIPGKSRDFGSEYLGTSAERSEARLFETLAASLVVANVFNSRRGCKLSFVERLASVTQFGGGHVSRDPGARRKLWL